MKIKFCTIRGIIRGGIKVFVRIIMRATVCSSWGFIYRKSWKNTKDFPAIVTRKTVNDDPDLDVRGKMAVENGCQVFVSLHTNAYSSPAACGVSVIYSLKRPESKAFGVTIGQDIAALMRQGDGVTYFRSAYTRAYPGTTDTDYYAVIRNAVRGRRGEVRLYIRAGLPHQSRRMRLAQRRRQSSCPGTNRSRSFCKLFGAQIPDPEPEPGYIVYTVVRGDTLIGIAGGTAPPRRSWPGLTILRTPA